jgi:hypothetical protein
MSVLIAFIPEERAAVIHLQRVIEGEDWDRIILIGEGEFKSAKAFIRVFSDRTLYLTELKKSYEEQMRDKVKVFEVGVNLMGGSGKEHMALIAAVLSLGLGIRFVALTPGGVREI